MTVAEAELGGRFEILRTLGRGAFAVTYAARERTSGNEVALKVLSLQTVDHWKAVELFEREARVLRHLSHPAIPRYVDFIPPSEGEPTFVLVQELAPGMSLAARVKDGWRANEEQLYDLARQILDVLVYLHALSPQVLHRDVKPENLVLADDGRVKVVDFGSVRDSLASEGQIGSVVGSFGYMAPEQLQGRAGPESDLYGFGATLVHLLTGRHPSELPHRGLAIDLDAILPMRHKLRNWLARLVAPDPDGRFGSAAEALAALPVVASEQLAHAEPTTRLRRVNPVVRAAKPIMHPAEVQPTPNLPGAEEIYRNSDAALVARALHPVDGPMWRTALLGAACSSCWGGAAIGATDRGEGARALVGLAGIAAAVFVIWVLTLPLRQLAARGDDRRRLKARIGTTALDALRRMRMAERAGRGEDAKHWRNLALANDKSGTVVQSWLGKKSRLVPVERWDD